MHDGQAVPAGTTSEVDYLQLKVGLADGEAFYPEALPGFRGLESMRAYGLPVKVECAGADAGVCATCHLQVPEAWQAVLPPSAGEESDQPGESPGADGTSRLACQIKLTPQLDGLVCEIRPDSLRASTHQSTGD